MEISLQGVVFGVLFYVVFRLWKQREELRLKNRQLTDMILDPEQDQLLSAMELLKMGMSYSEHEDKWWVNGEKGSSMRATIRKAITIAHIRRNNVALPPVTS